MTATSPHSNDNLVIFKVGPVPCCVDSQHVLAVIEPPAHITAIPGSNAFRPGLFSYQKRAVAVYDVRTKFSLGTEQRGKIMLSEMNQQLYGFWVDQIQQIALSSQGRMQILPAECPKELFESLFILNDQIIFKTSFEALSKAQVSTRAQQFIQQFVKEKIEQQKPANQRLSQSDSKTGLEANKTQKRPTTDNKHTKPVIKSVDNSHTSSPGKHAPGTDKKETQNPAVKSISDGFLNKTTKTEKTFTATKTVATDLNKKPSSITSNAFDDVKFPQQTTSAKTHKAQQKNADKFEKKNTQLSGQPVTPHSQKYAANSYALSEETQSSQTSTNVTSVTYNSKLSKDKAQLPRKSSNKNKHPSPIDKKPETQARQSKQKENENNSDWGIIFFIIILFLPVAYFGWDLLQSQETKSSYRPTKPEQEKSARIDTEEKPFENTIENIIAEPETSSEAYSETVSDIPIDDTTEPESAEQSVIATDYSTKIIGEDSDETETDESYQANIEKQDDDITITLSGPDVELNTMNAETNPTEQAEDIDKQQQENRPVQAATTETIEKDIDPATTIEPAIKTVESRHITAKSHVQSNSKKIIHIVVKGDTLWHIAKRYVRNPFKYNKLARLSKIKNPDLIYPGNRVIILIENNKK